MYSVTQTITKKRFLLKPKQVKQIYTFVTYSEALKFALCEQIRYIDCNISDSITTKRKVFELYHTLEQFKKVSRKNPIYYLGTNNPKRIDIEKYYFYLISCNKLEKLRKYIQ